jgi:hypothetical protein
MGDSDSDTSATAPSVSDASKLIQSSPETSLTNVNQGHAVSTPLGYVDGDQGHGEPRSSFTGSLISSGTSAAKSEPSLARPQASLSSRPAAGMQAKRRATEPATTSLPEGGASAPLGKKLEPFIDPPLAAFMSVPPSAKTNASRVTASRISFGIVKADEECASCNASVYWRMLVSADHKLRSRSVSTLESAHGRASIVKFILPLKIYVM